MAFQTLSAVLTLDSSGFRSSVDSAKRELGSLSDRAASAGRSMQQLGTAMTVGVTAPLAAVGVYSIRAASDLEEMQSKMSVVFGDLEEDIVEWSETHAKEVNRSAHQLQEYATSLQDTFVPMGFARDEAASMSKEMTELAIDLASFNNMAEADAMRKLEAGLIGNHRALRDFGVAINNSTLEQELMNQGMAESVQKASEQEKMMARLAIIQRSTSDAQGDAARTSESFANKMRGLRAQADELAAQLGEHLLPMTSSLIDRISAGIKWFSAWDESHQKMAVGAAVVAAALGPLLVIVGTFLTVLPAMAAGWGILAGVMTGTVVPAIGSVYAALGPIGWILGGLTLAVGALAAAWKTDFMGIRGHTENAVNAVIGLVNQLIARINSILPDKYHIDFEASEVDFSKQTEQAAAEGEQTGEAAVNALKTELRSGDDAIKQAGTSHGEQYRQGVIQGASGGDGEIIAQTTPAIRKALEAGVAGYNSDPENIGDETVVNQDLLEAVAAQQGGATPESMGISAAEFNRLMGGGGGGPSAGLMAGAAGGAGGGGGGGTDLPTAIRKALEGMAMRLNLDVGDETLARVIEEEIRGELRAEADRASRGVGGAGNPGAGR